MRYRQENAPDSNHSGRMKTKLGLFIKTSLAYKMKKIHFLHCDTIDNLSQLLLKVANLKL